MPTPSDLINMGFAKQDVSIRHAHGGYKSVAQDLSFEMPEKTVKKIASPKKRERVLPAVRKESPGT